MDMSLARVPLLLLATGGLHRCLTNPNPPVPAEERKKFTGSTSFTGNIITWWPGILKYGLWAGALCETAVVLSSHYPYMPYTSHLISALTPGPTSAMSIRTTPPFLVGAALACFGSLVRYESYRALGRHFTYQLSFRDDQHLTTSGLYTWVRHPGYSGFLIAFAGICTCWFSDGSWLKECRVLETLAGKAVVGLSMLSGLGLYYVCLFRPAREDVAMRERFGEKWDAWAARVPYRLFPYIY